MKIKIGTVVKDKVTGLIGVAENRASYLFGVDRYCVQPLARNNTVPEAVMIDEMQLEICKDESIRMEPMPEPKQIVKLGQVVTDIVTTTKGIATGRAVYLNGCARILVEWVNTETSDTIERWFDERRLTTDGAIIITDKSATKSSGGPCVSSKH